MAVKDRDKKFRRKVNKAAKKQNGKPKTGKTEQEKKEVFLKRDNRGCSKWARGNKREVPL